ncbi:MAG: PIN domain-containing protein [Thermodesulfobacteriota bacterium]
MIVYADTSGLFALMVRDDFMHVRAQLNFAHLASHDGRLLTSSYVLLETESLLQRRVGLAAVADFQLKIQPLLEIIWVDAEWHGRAMQRLLAEGNRALSLVDCLGFEIMESRDLEIALAFDRHFEEKGFTIAAFHDLGSYG